MQIDADSGAITGSLAVGTAAAGPYTVTVVANDGTYSAQQSFLWSLANPITIADVAAQGKSEGDSVSLSLSSSGGGTLSYAAKGLPAGLSINPSTGAITGTVAVGTRGTYDVTVLVGDGTYSAAKSIPFTIGNPITITVPATRANFEGDTTSWSLAATDTSSGTLTYAAVGLPPGITLDPSSGALYGSIPTGVSGIGTYTPTITVSDGTYSSSIRQAVANDLPLIGQTCY